MNKCEESGGVYYCYKCLEGDNRGKYYLEYNRDSDRCMLLFKGINGDLDHWVIGDSVMKGLY